MSDTSDDIQADLRARISTVRQGLPDEDFLDWFITEIRDIAKSPGAGNTDRLVALGDDLSDLRYEMGIFAKDAAEALERIERIFAENLPY